MMKTIILEKEKVYCGTVLLVNAGHPIKEKEAAGLMPADMHFPDILMRRDAANALQFIIKKISAGNAIVPVSGYRSSEEQAAIYEGSLKDRGKEFTKKYVALPDHSEHQTGLAIDLGQNKEDLDFICPCFPYDGIYGEFRRTAPDYGFIERYAKDKEDITGISHEPWHFRYVGWPHSKIITEKGFSLEEYIEFIKSYQDDCRFVYEPDYGTGIEIYYAPANGSQTLVVMPETCLYQISGNNTDGFIITVWKNFRK